jgi:hypothetical protein
VIGPNQPGFSFNEITIRTNAPTQSGVYALYHDRWVYVGESENIRKRLLEHLRGDTPSVSRHAPTGFTFELAPASTRVARQDQLILQLAPLANQKLG